MNKAINREKLSQLFYPGALESRLRQIDEVHRLNRIFIMGCGRSGTWMLASIFSTFKNVELFPHEVPVEYFGILDSSLPTLVLKRDSGSYQRLEEIPQSIQIVWIVRHPFDVLTSHNPAIGRKYHIQPHRWLGEMLALQYLIDTNRPNTKILRYEDIVMDPDSIQRDIANEFGLEIAAPVDDIPSTFKVNPGTVKAMHGLRKIDRNSLYKFKTDPEKIEYIIEKLPRLGRPLDWVASEFSYDLSFQD